MPSFRLCPALLFNAPSFPLSAKSSTAISPPRRFCPTSKNPIRLAGPSFLVQGTSTANRPDQSLQVTSPLVPSSTFVVGLHFSWAALCLTLPLHTHLTGHLLLWKHGLRQQRQRPARGITGANIRQVLQDQSQPLASSRRIGKDAHRSVSQPALLPPLWTRACPFRSPPSLLFFLVV